jgi:uroporphyrinogen-III decarboxylase
MELTPRARVETALHGETADRVPFTVYWLMFPRGQAERSLRNAGVTVVERVPLFRVQMPDVEVVTREYLQDGALQQRRELRTPVGAVHATFKREKTFGTSWWQTDYYIKEEADYKVLEFVLKDRSYTPAFEEFRLQVKRYGEDGYVVGNTEYSPMNLLIYEFLGLERFSIDLLDQPERILGLYEILREKQRQMFDICAASPAEFILYGGNISQEAIGIERFRKYFLPSIDEFCDTMHQSGKLAGCHLDAPMATLVDAVAESRLDVIEAFTPKPTCDVTVAEARKAWKDKILWINFPSSVHLETEDRIQAELNRILREAIPGDRFLIGITEDVPEEIWPRSFKILNDGLRRWGRLPLSEADFGSQASADFT